MIYYKKKLNYEKMENLDELIKKIITEKNITADKLIKKLGIDVRHCSDADKEIINDILKSATTDSKQKILGIIKILKKE